MVNIIDGVKQYKYFRKDFTEEERASYNQYVSNRMCAYFKTEKGKLKANENNRKYYYKKKEEALERTRLPFTEINQNQINEIEEHEII
jgi:hypothetical protein